MYLGYKENKIKFYTAQPLDVSLYQIDKIEETDKEYILEGDEYVLKDEVWEEEQKKKERERLDSLSMRRGDVFEALILAKGLGKSQIRTMIEQAELDDITKALYLNRFDEALDFYRGYPIFNLLCETLDITPKMLDKFFETKDYKYLTTCTLTVNVVPETATVTGAGTYPYGSTVDVIVACEGYINYAETLTLTEDVTLNVELEKYNNGAEQTSDSIDEDAITSSNGSVVLDETNSLEG